VGKDGSRHDYGSTKVSVDKIQDLHRRSRYSLINEPTIIISGPVWSRIKTFPDDLNLRANSRQEVMDVQGQPGKGGIIAKVDDPDCLFFCD